MKTEQQRPSRSRLQRNLLAVALCTCIGAVSAPALAQSTSAAVRGHAAANAQVTATNPATGFVRSTKAGSDGNYNLGGLPPGEYKIEIVANGQTTTRNLQLGVGQTATLDAAGSAPATGNELGQVVVTGAPVVETKTSEVATYVTPRQIEALPQSSRNFLAYADIVPGVQFVRNNNGETQLRGGAQSANGINVFIDGVGQKNYVLQGGISGQDSSKGNPFPQLAIGEFKVITSNYKAEYDQLSSAAIVAVTKSGTNQFHGSAFYDQTKTAWRTRNVFEERNHSDKVETGEKQYGFSLGGPIIRDALHFFVTAEEKKFNIPKDVIPGRGYQPNQLPSGWVAGGGYSSPFEEKLYFAKLDWSIGQDHYFELTGKRRNETEVTNVGGTVTPEHATQKKNDETRFDLRYQFTHGDWLNDAHITYEDARYNPRPLNMTVGRVLTMQGQWWDPIIRFGGGEDFQDKSQKGWGFQDDLTFTGLSGHTFKGGIKYKSVKLTATEQQPYNPQFYYEVANTSAPPWSVRFGSVLPGVGNGSAQSKNKQLGLYFQDDWVVNPHWTLNLGLRWDYEDSPIYNKYATPAAVVAAFDALDPRAPAGSGQTYRQTLAKGGIDINDFISNGGNRKTNKSNFSPRLGFSYDIDGDQRHVFFGGAGRSYDRDLFDWLQLETTKATFPTYQFYFKSAEHTCTVGTNNCYAWDPSFLDPAKLRSLATSNGAGREIDLLSNNLKTPYSDQYSIGMRNMLEFGKQTWTSSVTLSRIHSKDGFAYLLGNRNPDGSFFAPGATSGPPWGAGVPGYGSLILGVNGIETKATSLLVNLEKPYTRSSHWGATFAYTFTDARENRQFGEHYALDYPTLKGYGWHPAGGVPRHRLVATGIYDMPWGITGSAKLTLASQTPRYGNNCRTGWDQCYFESYYPHGTYGEKRFDLAFEKRWHLGGNVNLRTRLDAFNIFNWTNYDGWDDSAGGPGPAANPNYMLPNSASYKTREFKLTVGIDF